MCLPLVRICFSLNPRKHTDANDERADCEAGDGILQQVRRTSTQQRRRGAHAGIVVGRLERLAAYVSAVMRSRFTPTHYPMVALWTSLLLRGKLMVRLGGERLLPHVCLALAVHPAASICSYPSSTPKPNPVDNTTTSRALWLYYAHSTSYLLAYQGMKGLGTAGSGLYRAFSLAALRA